MRAAAVLLSCVVLAACEKPAPDRLPEVVKLQMQVEGLTHRIEALEQRNKIEDQMAADPKVVGAELRITDGGRPSTVDHPDMASCQRAQAAALSENQRRADAMAARNASNPGFQELGGPRVDAFCVPR